MDVCIHLSKNVKHILWLGRVLGDEGGYSSKRDRQKNTCSYESYMLTEEVNTNLNMKYTRQY